MSEEIFDVVDENDAVVGQLPRSQVHARGLLHRAVSIFVFNLRGQLLLQLRTPTKDEYPNCYTSSASGHLSAGEDYNDAAPRELEEELGLTSPLTRLAKFPGGPETANEFTVLYKTVTDETPTFDPVEIAAGEYLDIHEIRRRLDARPEDFTPPFRTLFRWYLQNCGE
ncbi:NUDIX domain-containing protein [bacterium]|nr:NUDIX domain-containing protein [bacterium]